MLFAPASKPVNPAAALEKNGFHLCDKLRDEEDKGALLLTGFVQKKREQKRDFYCS